MTDREILHTYYSKIYKDNFDEEVFDYDMSSEEYGDDGDVYLNYYLFDLLKHENAKAFWGDDWKTLLSYMVTVYEPNEYIKYIEKFL